MKKISFRLVSLVLALALCLLPTVAGAFKLDRDTLEFTVGEKSEERFWYTREPGDPKETGHNVSGCGNPKYDLLALISSIDGAKVYGTPTKAGDYWGSFKILYENEKRDTVEVSLPIHIIIHPAKTPETPTPTPSPAPAPVERPEIVDYSRCEQALIRSVKEWCNIRQRADINSDVIGRAMLGQRISLICWNEDETWCYVDCGGEQGWIAKQFILPIK